MAKKDINIDKKNNFGRELKAEMKKVTWPSMKKLVNNTSAVISITLVVALIVFVIDLCFENLNKFGIERIKTAVSSETEESENSTEDAGAEVDLTDAEVTEDSAGTDATVVEPGTDDAQNAESQAPAETTDAAQTTETSN